jgi:hypothetical protein
MSLGVRPDRSMGIEPFRLKRFRMVRLALCAMSKPPRSRHGHGGLAADSSRRPPRPPIAPWSTVRTRVSRYYLTAPVNERRGGGIALERYDLVIVGGGAAGINALKAAVALKAKIALVDRGPLGGTCVNRG